MAVTLTTAPQYPIGFFLTVDSDDFSGTEIARAAPATGVSIYIDHVIVKNGATATTVTIGEGETAGNLDTKLIGPLDLDADQSIDIPLRRPIKLTAATLLAVDAAASSAGSFVLIQGFER